MGTVPCISTSDYQSALMNMLGLVKYEGKKGGAVMVTTLRLFLYI
jgi:hypothetical protein